MTAGASCVWCGIELPAAGTMHFCLMRRRGRHPWTPERRERLVSSRRQLPLFPEER